MASGAQSRISNVLGTPVFQWVINQLGTRAENNSRDTRDDSNLIYLANKTGWFRIVSSVRIPATTNDTQDVNIPNVFNAPNFNGSFSTRATSKTYTYFKDKYPNDITDQDSLAKKFVLFAGTSAYNKPNQDPQDNNFSYNLRETAYGILGDQEIKEYGRRPMPGITSVQIDTQGALGSIRAANINFKVWDKDQLDVIDALYFKLGYTMLLEWGNTFYYKTGDSALSKGEDSQIDPFSKTRNSKEQINSQIQNNIRQSEGNYDGMLGLVTNFNFSFNQEGGYDCTLKIQALGSLGDSIKINHSSALPALYVNKVKTTINDENQKKLDEAERQKNLDFEKATKDLQKRLEDQKQLLNSTFFDPLVNLLINTRKVSVDGDNDVIIRQPSDTQNRIVINKDFIQKADKNIISSRVSNYEIKNKILSSKGRSTGISISNKSDIVYLYTNSQDKDLKKYLDGGQADKIKVILDSNYLNKISNQQIYDWNNFYKQKSAGLSKPVTNVFDYIADKNSALTYIPQDQVSAYQVSYTPLNKESSVYLQGSDLTFTLKSVEYKNFNFIAENLTNTGASQEVKVVLTLDRNPTIELTITDMSLIKDIEYLPGFESNLISEADKAINLISKQIEQVRNSIEADFQIKTKELSKQNSEAETKQIEDATNYQSALEIMLKIIQLESFNFAQNKQFSDVIKYDLTQLDSSTNVRFIDELFSEGIFEGRIQNLLDKVKELESAKAAVGTDKSKLENLNKNYTNQNQDQQFLINAAFGFNHNFMAGNSDVASTPLVKYKSVNAEDHSLFNAYVLPQDVKSAINEGSIYLNHPVYIPFGLLIMMINHICVVYDGSSPSQLTPMVYVNYNPDTNFCLTNAKQLSTDITKFLIGYQGTNESYQELFDENVLTNDKKTLIQTKDSTKTDIFAPQSDDTISGKIPQFKKVNGSSYQGRLMNVLVNINYATKLVAEFSYRDGTNSVYLKQFLEQILVDMNKSLGNFNILRLSYHDPSNVFVIVDDQQTKVADGEIQLTAQNSGYTNINDNISELPVFGKKSIAKSIELRTDISTRLGSLIAISANSDPSRQVGLSTDASSFGFVNTDFQDRFISIATDIYMDKKQQNSTKNDAIVNEAKMFDEYIKSIYKYADSYDESKISFATNYFIQKMSILKNKEIATRASAMIPVSLNISLDGISGFQMTQLFTIGDSFLPYNYTKIKEGNPFTSIGFAIVGLTHTIENNQWTTSLRTHMSYLRNNVNDYDADKTRTIYSSEKPKRSLNSVGGQDTSGNQQTNFIASGKFSDQAKSEAVTYLGSNLTDRDWSQLVAATGAEAGFPRDTSEIAWILGVILNRVRLNTYGSSVYNVLHGQNQFQAVTGTPDNNRTASPSYISGPNDADTLYKAIIAELKNVPKDYINFTSNNPAAYKNGANINVLYELEKKASQKVYGGTIFTKK